MKDWVLTPDRYLSKEEIGKLLRKAEELRSLGIAKNRRQQIQDWLFLRLALFSGLRASEICDLRITDCHIGYAHSELVVRCGKGRKQRVVRIGPDLKRDLRWYLRWRAQAGELHADAHLLRSKRSERMNRSALWRRWNRYCPVHRLHDARHTNATLLYEATQDLRLVQKQLAESGELTTRSFTRSPGLVLRFRSYGSIVADRWPTRLDIKMPFFHLSTQGFWQPLDAEMRPAKSPESCVVCEMQPELFDLIADADFRLKARLVLVSKYFAPMERIALFEGLGLQAGSIKGVKVDNVVREAAEAAKSKGRDARFSVRVVVEYRYTCPLTGYRCITDDGAAVVDAAHIEQWARTQNDDLTNGLALSKTAHWMFDEGLWSADDELRVNVNARRFCENGPEPLRLSSFIGRHLQFDPGAKLRPSVEYLRNHRAHHGWRT